MARGINRSVVAVVVGSLRRRRLGGDGSGRQRWLRRRRRRRRRRGALALFARPCVCPSGSSERPDCAAGRPRLRVCPSARLSTSAPQAAREAFGRRAQRRPAGRPAGPTAAASQYRGADAAGAASHWPTVDVGGDGGDYDEPSGRLRQRIVTEHCVRLLPAKNSSSPWTQMMSISNNNSNQEARPTSNLELHVIGNYIRVSVTIDTSK